MAVPLIPVALAIAQYAPSLIRHLTGSSRAADVAEQVVGLAQAVTRTQTPEDALDSLQVSVEAQEKLRAAAAAADLDLERLAAGDRADARARDLELAKLGTRNLRADLMVVLDVVGALACLVAIVYVTVLGARGAVDGATVGAVTGSVGTLAGLFLSGLRDAHQFEFGSSRGSVEKTAWLAGLDKTSR